MEIESGKYTHKKTILRYLLDSGLDIEDGKSSDRLLRVRYFADGQSDWDQSKLDHPVSDPSTFQLGSLYATLVSVDQTKVAIAILQCTLLKSGSEYLDRVPLDEISLHDSAYEVSGQILSFIPLPHSTDGMLTLSWLWDGQYVSLNPAAKSKSNPSRQPTQQTSNATTRLRHLSFSVNGSLVYALAEWQISSISADKIPSEESDVIPGYMDTTWIMTENNLNEVEHVLARRVHENNDLRQKIPVFGPVREGVFPYSAAYSR
jgi:hypothetical protein